MTATTFLPAKLQANATNTIVRGSGSAAGMNGQGSAADATDPTADSSPVSFGAVFQQLMGKILPPASDLSPLEATTEKVDAGETAAEDLDALLPFLEAMGLAQPIAPEAVPITPAVTEHPATFDQAAITAGKASIELDLKPTTAQAAETSEVMIGQPENTPELLAVQGEQDKETTTGREFSAKLTTAIESNRQSGQLIGTTNVVHQSIATTSPTNAPATVAITHPVGESGWGQELSQRIVWMANRSEGKAELVLTPPQMGRVEVSLTVSGDQATASFASANPVVREALESALPRLREALAEAGIQLGQAQVGAENPHQSAQQEKNPDKLAAHPETSVENSSIMMTSDHDSATSALKVGRGLVDVFA